MLTGWIPETVSFDDVSNKENLWTRLVQNFRDQNIIMCIETASKDAFTILELIEFEDIRVIQCKSPYKNDPRIQQLVQGEELPTELQRENKAYQESGVFFLEWTENI